MDLGSISDIVVIGIIAIAVIIVVMPFMWLSQCAANTKKTVKLLKELLEQTKKGK